MYDMKLLVALAMAALVPATESPAADTWGVSYPGGPRGVLSRVDPVSLQPIGRRLAVPGHMWGATRFGSQLALGVSNRGRILVVDGRSGRSRVVRVGERTGVRHLLWKRADRLVALGGFEALRVWVIDPRNGGVVSRRSLGGAEVAVARTDDAVVFLLGSTQQVEESVLAVVHADGSVQTIPLPAVRSGFHRRDDLRPVDPPDLVPGLAVRNGVAYVLRADRDVVVRVELASGAVSSHALPSSARARAAKGAPVRQRQLDVLPDGRLVGSGADIWLRGGPRYWGLRVIDPSTWRARVIQARAHFFQRAGDVLLYTRYERRRRRPPAVFAYSPAGRRLWSFAPRYGISNVLVVGGYVYVKNGARKGANHRTHVVRVRSGRVARVLRFTNTPSLIE